MRTRLTDFQANKLIVRFGAGLFACLFLFLASCTTPTLPETAVRQPLQVTILADGETHTVTTEAGNVRELLAEANITYGDADLIDPRLTEPLSDGLTINIIRVTESIDIIPRSIPFDRKIVRSEAMNADDPPRILQAGQAGLQETRVRIVYHDGIEQQRIPIDVTVVKEARDEIVMVGIGAVRDNLRFAGNLAYISDGTAVILRGSTLFPEQLNTGGPLDGRVFTLSPTGSHLLYTRTSTQTVGFNNSLWVLSTERGAQPRSLNISNILWADWNPARTELLQIAYTTAISTSLPPGWEANNDLWLGDVLQNEAAPFRPEQVVESYPATFGWWGGNYAWSPQGQAIAYSYANEVGVINLDAPSLEEQRRQLQQFTEYNTLADWVWVPTLSWSSDGRFLAFTNHNSSDSEAQTFDSWVVDASTGLAGDFVPDAGMWAHLHWSPENAPTDSQIAFLRTTNPLDSQRSSYTLWLMDQDGSNTRQIYPATGENSSFPRDPNFMAWGPTAQDIAFVFDDGLFLLNLESGEAFRVTQDDARVSHPTWAPYGTAVTPNLPATEIEDPAAIETPPSNNLLPNE
ncbi:MAG: DUF348 domain-containing protein [Ardenticatenaceae bacterium]|nr:DUF348 domain-containing protein [Ardenticatenaceae bacterium]